MLAGEKAFVDAAARSGDVRKREGEKGKSVRGSAFGVLKNDEQVRHVRRRSMPVDGIQGPDRDDDLSDF
jgi:hypothetical protein